VSEIPASPPRTPWYRVLYLQVLIAVALGILIGRFFPEFGKALKPMGDAFIKLVKMMIGPIIFCTVVHGVASMRDLKKLGRVGVKALIYFEVISTLALVIGLVVVNTLKPGVGFNFDATKFDPAVGQAYAQKAHANNVTTFLLNIIPNTLFDAFVTGDQVTRGKPDPEIYVTAAARLGVVPQSCLALEDSSAGVLAATRAGMTTLLIPDNGRMPTPEASNAAFRVLESLHDARQLLFEWLRAV